MGRYAGMIGTQSVIVSCNDEASVEVCVSLV